MITNREKNRFLVRSAKVIRKGNESLRRKTISRGRRRQRRGSERNALLMDAQIKLGKEEFALGMERRSHTNDAAAKGAQIKLIKEESARGTGKRSNDAAVKDVQINPSKEECALGMEHRSHDAAVKDAYT